MTLVERLKDLRNATHEVNTLTENLREAEQAAYRAARELQHEVNARAINVGDIVKLEGYYYRLEQPKNGVLKLQKQNAVKEFD